MNQSKLEQLTYLVPATPEMIAAWLMKVEGAGNDTLPILLTVMWAGYDVETGEDLLNELHNILRADGILHQIAILDEMGFDQQMAYRSELKLSTAAYFMLIHLSHCIGEFRQIREYLKGIEP